MLSAARNHAAICRLLILAGANADLVDAQGLCAFDIARSIGAQHAAIAIESAVTESVTAPTSDSSTHDLEYPRGDTTSAQINRDAHMIDLEGAAEVQSGGQSVDAPTKMFQPSPVPEWAYDECDLFDLSVWEPENDLSPPANDPTLAAAAVDTQTAITDHQPIDTSTDWANFEAFLPDRATPLPRADDAEARERLRRVLLRAIREGSVPHSAIEDLTRGEDGEPDPEAGALLGMVVNDLGAETDERFEYSAVHESFGDFVAPDEKPDEEDAVAEALEFLDDLAARRNEPLRLYQREIQREALLTVESEIALGQVMERGIEKALDALAAWPTGIVATLKAARLVANGAKPLRSMSSGQQVEPVENGPEGETTAEMDTGTQIDAELELAVADGKHANAEHEADSQYGLDAKASTDELAEFCATAELLSSMHVSASEDAAEWAPCRDALACLGLTRGFLMELADSGLAGEPDSAAAFNKAMGDYRRARDSMAVANLKLVYSIAKKYLFSGQPLDDLLQDGNIGLIKAVDRYDWRRGFKFSTYATWWIRQQIGRSLADTGKTIRLPVHIYEKTQRIARVAKAFEIQNGYAPALEEVATLVELPFQKVEAISRMGLEPLALHELPNIDDLVAVHAKDQFASRDPVECVEEIQLRESVDYLLSALNAKEECVLRMRFGLGKEGPLTLEEIGTRIDVTRERIRQVEANALRRLRHPALLDRLSDEIGLIPKVRQRANKRTELDAEHDGGKLTDRRKIVAPHLVLAAQVPAQPEGPAKIDAAALEKLLERARIIGFAVETSSDGAHLRVSVQIPESPDNQSRQIVHDLIGLGFEFRFESRTSGGNL